MLTHLTTPPILPAAPPPTQRDTMDVAAERAVIDLKGNLTDLGYPEHFDIQSASLVSRLLGDLLLTTENYELLRLRTDSSNRAAVAATGEVMLLKMQDERRTRECDEVREEAYS